MNRVFIKELECFGYHGVLKEENILGQKFVVSCELLMPTPENDNVEECANYAEIAKFITEYTKGNTFDLIETLAHKLAVSIITKYKAKEIKLTVEKPWAPVGLPLKSVGTTVKMCFHDVYLSVGSNMGDKRAHIEKAVKRLSDNECISECKCSTLIETEPYGYTEQPAFLNGCIYIKTLYEPEELLKVLNKIEAELGRERKIHWGPRTIDLDIILFDNIVMNTERLTIPHADMHNREFVLAPLCELASWLIHPVLNKRITDLYNEVKRGENGAT